MSSCLPTLQIREEDEYSIQNVDCKQFDVGNLCSFSSSGGSVSVLGVNIRSCRKNFAALESFLSLCRCDFDFITITETWLDENDNHIFNIDGYKKFCLFRNRHGGGIMIFVKCIFEAEMVDELSFISDFFEVLTLKVAIGNFSLSLSCLYRPPSGSIDHFNLNFINTILLKIANSNSILCGDININLFNPLNSNHIDNFMNNMSGHGFYSVIDKATRLSPENAITKYSLIDHIWFNFHPRDEVESGVVLLEISDHMPVICKFNVNYSQQDSYFYTRKVSGIDRSDSFVQKVNNINFYNCDTDDVNVFASYFLRNIYSAFTESFPIVKFKMKTQCRRAEWITDDIKYLTKKKHELLKLSNRNIIFHFSYKIFRNKLNSLILKVKNLYFLNKIKNIGNKPIKTWEFINKILDRKPVKNTEIRIINNNRQLFGLDLCNHFNSHLTSIASKLVSELPPTDDVITVHSPRVCNTCVPLEVTESEVGDVVLSYKSKRFHTNEIQPFLLCKVLDVICPVLCRLFNTCIRTGIYPDEFKIARVIPIYKAGDKFNVANYRPISTISIFSKIFEKLIHSRLQSFVTIENIITPHQFGFRRDSTTTLAILEVVSSILKTFHNKAHSINLFLDLKRAFETIDKDILLMKLEHYGVRGTFNHLFNSYLSNRKQYVQINNFKSSYQPITTGLMQGCILAPLLFNLYINDIVYICKYNNMGCTLFADDAVFYNINESFNDTVSHMNNFTRVLSKYLLLNKLSPNVDKTKLMFFSTTKIEILPQITFNNSILEWVCDFKYLGLYIDSNLNFKTHVKYLCSRLSRVQGILHSTSRILNRKCQMLIFYSLGYSILIQSIIIYGKTHSYILQPLIVILNNILRIILKVRRDENFIPQMSVNSMYFNLELLQFPDIYCYFLMKFFRNAILNESLYHRYFSEYLPDHGYQTRNNRFNLPAIRLEIERNSTIFQAINHYNNLPEPLIQTMSDHTFKISYKQFILNQYAPP